VVGGAVVQVELHHPLGFQGFAVAKQQEFHPGGQGGNDRDGLGAAKTTGWAWAPTN
jgi:hypothetical protein